MADPVSGGSAAAVAPIGPPRAPALGALRRAVDGSAAAVAPIGPQRAIAIARGL
jgi:hypothetical protein